MAVLRVTRTILATLVTLVFCFIGGVVQLALFLGCFVYLAIMLGVYNP